MRKFIFLLLVVLSFGNKAKAQCAPNAAAYFDVYVRIVGLGPNGPVSDTSLGLTVINFDPHTKVYFYDFNNILVDSVTTSDNGYGVVGLRPAYIDSMCDAPFGNCGFATNGSCTVPIMEITLLPVKLVSFDVINQNGRTKLNWQTAAEEQGTKYIIQESNYGVNFTDLHQQLAVPASNGRYSYTTPNAIRQRMYFRIKIMDNIGHVVYSDTKVANPSDVFSGIQISSTGSGTAVTVANEFISGSYSVFNTTGALLETKAVTSNYFSIKVQLKKGIYFLRVTGNAGVVLSKPFAVF